MRIFDMISICFRNLWRRKGRTMLTIIGVVIGSCAVIVMISLGLGMSKAMDGMLASWGDLTAVTIRGESGGMSDSSSNNNNNSNKPKLDDKALEMLAQIEHVENVIPKMEIDNSMLTIVTGRNDRYKLAYVSVVGVDFSKFDELGYAAEEGDLPNADDKNSSIAIGLQIPYLFTDTKKHGTAARIERQQLADGSYTKPFFEPLGADIMFNINNTKKQNADGTNQYGGRGYEHRLEVKTILKEDTMWETPYSIFIDIDLAKQLINEYNKLNNNKKAKEPEYTQIKLLCDDISSVEYVQKFVEDLGYSATSMAQVREQMQGELGIIQGVLGGLAAISLLVAAISITNTMIMSIYERTREIGVMKVLGCFIGNIRAIFLMEAGMIGLLGGIIGTLISYGISIVMNTFMAGGMSEMLGMGAGEGGGEVSIIPLWLVLLALAFSTVIGLISGYYPANRAVKISALEAIKNE
ncbi:MAG: ABC transporter permease [Ruminiclostridium sp.]|nr:ABC transporter permease [Ruminiclostridium sp.]